MRKVQERNLQIVEMSRAGAPHAAIARQFNLSRSSVDVIVHKFEEQRQLAERSTRLRDEIRQADDLDREWPTGDILTALGLSTMTATALAKPFEQEATKTTTRCLMDLAVPVGDPSSSGDPFVGLIRVRFVGKRGFWSVIHGIAHLVGHRCDQEWQRRMILLRHRWQINGPLPYSRPKLASPTPGFAV
jgi:transposase